MRTILSVLDASGDMEIRWDHANPEEVEEARRAVLDLKRQGYSFFLVDGAPAPDEVSTAAGMLSCRRMVAEDLLPEPPAAGDTEPQAEEKALSSKPETDATVRTGRRGRKRQTTTEDSQTVKAVAVRPLRGG